ncbi:MAG TPA: aldo/keto reductase [Methylomirabilota bacterium]|nr:aldo/keto reductase [Methylomirabilota bacterium]
MASTVRIGDLTVNRLGFGAMRLCGTNIWGPPKDRAAAHAVLRKAYDLGLNFFDTADSYGPHVDEELIAETLHPYTKDLVIATKGGLLRPRPGAWDPDGRPEHLKRAIDGSLKRLKLECIDLYQLHAPDAKVPFADSVGALADGQRAGKIRHVGLSNVSVRQLEEARIAFLPWYPLGGGAALKSSKVKSLAKKHRARPAQIALAWLLAKSPVVLPIPGTADLEHLEENAGAAQLTLSPAEMRELN